MFIKDWKKDVFTIPNILSMFRLLLIPVYITIYLEAEQLRDYYLAGGILALSCLTDLVDGKIARHFNMISTLGKFLDPLADKLTQFTLIICLSITHPVLQFVLVLFFIKEVFQLLVAVIHYCRGQMLPGALMAGKVCTTVLFVSMILLVLLPQLNESVVNLIAIVDTGFLLFAFVRYVMAYFGTDPKVEDFHA